MYYERNTVNFPNRILSFFSTPTTTSGKIEPPPNVVKISVNVTEEAFTAFNKIAKTEGITLTQAINNAIATYKFFADELKAGGKVFIKEKNGTMKEVEW